MCYCRLHQAVLVKETPKYKILEYVIFKHFVVHDINITFCEYAPVKYQLLSFVKIQH